jgi:tetratricopeptide (TPR) repeat protein
MTNPHTPFPLQLIKPANHTCNKVHPSGWAVWAFGVMLLLASVHGHAQSVEALEWQPGPSMATKLVLSTPHNDVRKLLRQAKYPQALLLVNKSLATNPRDPQMRFWQGFIFEQLGQPDMALQVYLDLTREYPELAEPFNNLGVIYAAKGDYPNAKVALDNALRANPKYAAAHENMGDLLVNMARQSYVQSLSIDPKQRGIQQKIDQLTPVLDITQGKP